MSANREDLLRLLSLAEDDFRSGMAKLTEFRTWLAHTPIPGGTGRVPCPECGVSLEGPRRLAEHLYIQHDGAEPAHWIEAEERVL